MSGMDHQDPPPSYEDEIFLAQAEENTTHTQGVSSSSQSGRVHGAHEDLRRVQTSGPSNPKRDSVQRSRTTGAPPMPVPPPSASHSQYQYPPSPWTNGNQSLPSSPHSTTFLIPSAHSSPRHSYQDYNQSYHAPQAHFVPPPSPRLDPRRYSQRPSAPPSPQLHPQYGPNPMVPPSPRLNPRYSQRPSAPPSPRLDPRYSQRPNAPPSQTRMYDLDVESQRTEKPPMGGNDGRRRRLDTNQAVIAPVVMVTRPARSRSTLYLWICMALLVILGIVGVSVGLTLSNKKPPTS